MATTRTVPRRAARASFPLRVRRRLRASLDIPRVARYSYRWDSLAGACAGAYTGLCFPFFVRIARGDLHAPETAIALMTAAPFIGNLMSPLWASRMEGRDKMPFCFYTWVIARALLFLCLLPIAGEAWPFIAIVSALQFIGTISSPAYASMMRDIYPDTARGRLMGYVRVGTQTMAFIATLVAGRLLDHAVSFRFLFPLAGFFGICAALSFRRVRPMPSALAMSDLESKPQGLPQFVRGTLSILRYNKGYRWFAMSVFVYGAGNLMITPIYALYQVDRLHITNTQIANLANFGAICSIAGSFFWGRFTDRKGAPLTVLYCILLITIIPIVYLCASTYETLLFASLLSGFGFAGIELAYLASILLYAEPGKAAQYQSLHSLLLGVRGVLAPMIGIPLMTTLGYPPTFLIAAATMFGGAFLQWLAIRANSGRLSRAR